MRSLSILGDAGRQIDLRADPTRLQVKGVTVDEQPTPRNETTAIEADDLITRELHPVYSDIEIDCGL